MQAEINSLVAQSFNSIKVRLNQGVGSLEGELLAFQFHKGTIKPQIRC